RELAGGPRLRVVGDHVDDVGVDVIHGQQAQGIVAHGWKVHHLGIDVDVLPPRRASLPRCVASALCLTVEVVARALSDRPASATIARMGRTPTQWAWVPVLLRARWAVVGVLAALAVLLAGVPALASETFEWYVARQAGGPPASNSHAMAYDSARARTV